MTISIQSISIYRDNYSNRVQLVHSPALGAPLQKIQAPEWTSSHSYPAAICPGLHTSGDPAVEVTFQTTTPHRGSIRIGASVAVGDQLFALAPKSVQFLSSSIAVTFRLRLLHIVARDEITWQWYYLDSSDSPIPIQQTTHVIYRTLGQPRSPWLTECQDLSVWPNPAALDLACRWASGSTNLSEAASKITASLFALESQQLLIYSSDSKHFFDRDWFNLPNLLSLLLPGATQKGIDCQGTSAAVVTLTNLLGARLEMARLSMPDYVTPFRLKPVRLVGKSLVQPEPFHFHQIAVDTSLAGDDLVWDACLAVPAKSGEAPPAAMPLLTRSATPSYADAVIDDPRFSSLLVGRVGTPRIGAAGPSFELEVPPFPAYFDFSRWYLHRSTAFRGFAVWGLARAASPSLPGWTIIQSSAFSPSRFPRWISRWQSQNGEALTVDLIECPSRSAAHLALYQTLDSISASAPTLLVPALGSDGPAFPGDVCFQIGSSPANLAIARGNLLIELHANSPATALLFATQLDDLLLHHDPSPLPPPAFAAPTLDPLPPPAPPFWYRIFSKQSDLQVSSGNVFLRDLNPDDSHCLVEVFTDGLEPVAPRRFEYTFN